MPIIQSFKSPPKMHLFLEYYLNIKYFPPRTWSVVMETWKVWNESKSFVQGNMSKSRGTNCLVFVVTMRCYDHADSTSRFFAPGYLCYHMTVTPGVKPICGIWTTLSNFGNKTLVLEFHKLPHCNDLPRLINNSTRSTRKVEWRRWRSGQAF